jgi:hypothetical protein
LFRKEEGKIMNVLCVLLATTVVHASSPPKTPQAEHEIPEIGKKREIDAKAPAKKKYKSSKFESCGVEQKNWEPVTGKRLVQALVVKTIGGFAPAIEGDPSAHCEVLVVDEKDDVLGNLRPLGSSNSVAAYSIIPGEMIGVPMARFFLAPNPDPTKPAQFFPATCSLQDAKPQLILTEPSSSYTDVISLDDEKSKPEPPQKSDAGDA